MCPLLKGCLLENNSVDYEEIADKITDEVAKKLKKDKSLHLIGTGGAMMHDIQMMMMGFQFYQEVDIEAARELLVYSTEEYLSAINSNEEIRPYLHVYPFTAENVKVEIYFRKPDHHNVSPGQLNIAAVGEGKITYYTETSRMAPLQQKHEETYQDALKAVASSSNTEN